MASRTQRGLSTLKCTGFLLHRASVRTPSTTVFFIQARRDASSYGAASNHISKSNGAVQQRQLASTGLERLPTMSLLRNIMLGVMLTSPLCYKLGLSTLQTLAETRWSLLNPDKNPLLRMLIKLLFYDQFCAGTVPKEICHTRDGIKGMGYSGVVLCYGKEIQVSQSQQLHSTGDESLGGAAEIELWRAGNLETLTMIGEGDWLGMKLTGAGYAVTEALLQGQEPPPEFTKAVDDICAKARSQNCRLWIDAEQQVVQKTIDRWTIDMMRRHNTDGQAIVYNTLQAYLKQARNKLQDQIKIASDEGWTLAIKLVRGAYIANDQREKIHDTKQDTDDSYNGIVRDVLTGQAQAAAGHPNMKMRLILAGHNPESITRALELVEQLSSKKELKVLPDFGQLQGMADSLGCEFLKRCEALETTQKTNAKAVVPRIYKCLTWGSIQECMQYLVRRLVENKGGADRMRDGLSLYYSELKRRAFRRTTT